MKKIIATITFSLISSLSFGFQCGPEKSEKEKFKEAKSVLLFQVVATELKTTEFDGQEVGYSQATYRLIESFKGSEEKEGKVVEVLGYGTGLVGLIPGIYYLAFLGESNEYAKYPWLTICDVELSTFNIEGTEVEKKLEKIRALK
ncbi:hypothetical protein [Marinicella rhabdoformis]|uniref:hypothetical protein n=1 Tax=Marinicella rhabdoformis TaxID=2580566 RepID=UPI0012AEC77C|nr:hypothetical protein [Marinicella rhabdoformis]